MYAFCTADITIRTHADFTILIHTDCAVRWCAINFILYCKACIWENLHIHGFPSASIAFHPWIDSLAHTFRGKIESGITRCLKYIVHKFWVAYKSWEIVFANRYWYPKASKMLSTVLVLVGNTYRSMRIYDYNIKWLLFCRILTWVQVFLLLYSTPTSSWNRLVHIFIHQLHPHATCFTPQPRHQCSSSYWTESRSITSVKMQ